MAEGYSKKDYYFMMLNALSGLQDDLDANDAPQEAKEGLREVLQICREDFKARFC